MEKNILVDDYVEYLFDMNEFQVYVNDILMEQDLIYPINL
jgi:hypothetical protein